MTAAAMDSVATAMVAVGSCCSFLVIYAVVAYVRDLGLLEQQRTERHQHHQQKPWRDKAARDAEGSRYKTVRGADYSVGTVAEDSKVLVGALGDAVGMPRDGPNLVKGATSEEEPSKSKFATDSQALESGEFPARAKPVEVVVVHRVKANGPDRSENSWNMFQYLRIGISILGAFYPIWYVITYYIVYPEASFLRNCQILTRIDNVVFILLRGSVLMFYVLRLRMVRFTEVGFEYEFYGLVSGIFIASFFGLFQSVDIVPFSSDSGCDFKVGTAGLAGYTIYIVLTLVIHVLLFTKFVKTIRTQQAYMEAVNSYATRIKAAQFDRLIKRARYGVFACIFVAFPADLLFTLIYNAFFNEVFEGPNRSSLRFLLVLCDVLYYLDAVLGSLSVLSTHARFKEMLLCGKQIVNLRSLPQTSIPTAKITELHRKQEGIPEEDEE